jgi:hypothetical protein
MKGKLSVMSIALLLFASITGCEVTDLTGVQGDYGSFEYEDIANGIQEFAESIEELTSYVEDEFLVQDIESGTETEETEDPESEQL